MQEINEMIKEYDTDNSIVKEIDSIVYDLVDDDDIYESTYGDSKTIPEALKKIKGVINSSVLLPIELRLWEGDNKLISIYGSRTKKSPIDYNILTIGDMKFEKTNITSSSVKNGEIEIATITIHGYPGKKVWGVLNGVCTINNVKQICALRVEKIEGYNESKVYLLLKDTTVLTTTGQTLSIEASGSLKHDRTY